MRWHMIVRADQLAAAEQAAIDLVGPDGAGTFGMALYDPADTEQQTPVAYMTSWDFDATGYEAPAFAAALRSRGFKANEVAPRAAWSAGSNLDGLRVFAATAWGVRDVLERTGLEAPR